MRRLLPLALIASCLVAVPALAVSSPTYQVHVPAKFKSLLPGVKSKSGLKVRLPSTIPSYVKASKTFPSAGATHKHYDLELGAGRNCDGANACFIAAFQATRGAKLAFKKTVSLVNGITGYFKPVTCGASCSPSFIQWKEGKVLYEIELKGLASTKEKSEMKKLANSAIRGGNR